MLDRAKGPPLHFYLHYQNRDDLFLSEMEDGLQMWGNIFSTKQERKSGRLARVAEFFAYVASARKLYHSLVLSGRIQAFFDLA